MNMETELFIGGNSNFVIILLFNNFKDLLNNTIQRKRVLMKAYLKKLEFQI